jgi:hypothetical protein
MISLEAKFIDKIKALKKAKREGMIEGLYEAGAYIRRTARRLIRPNKKSSKPGTPPNTQTRILRESILFFVNRERESLIVGPSRRKVEMVGAVHEFGKTFMGRKYPKRPFMGPAFDIAKKRLPEKWKNSVR